jgi:hypothetical protein
LSAAAWLRTDGTTQTSSVLNASRQTKPFLQVRGPNGVGFTDGGWLVAVVCGAVGVAPVVGNAVVGVVVTTEVPDWALFFDPLAQASATPTARMPAMAIGIRVLVLIVVSCDQIRGAPAV